MCGALHLWTLVFGAWRLSSTIGPFTFYCYFPLVPSYHGIAVVLQGQKVCEGFRGHLVV